MFLGVIIKPTWNRWYKNFIFGSFYLLELHELCILQYLPWAPPIVFNNVQQTDYLVYEEGLLIPTRVCFSFKCCLFIPVHFHTTPELQTYKDSMPWKRFLHYWPFVKETAVTDGLPSQRASCSDVFVVMRLKKFSQKQTSCGWPETPWRPCDISLLWSPFIVVFTQKVLNYSPYMIIQSWSKQKHHSTRLN